MVNPVNPSLITPAVPEVDSATVSDKSTTATDQFVGLPRTFKTTGPHRRPVSGSVFPDLDPVAGHPHWPPFVDVKVLADFLKTSDGKIRLGAISPHKDLETGEYRIKIFLADENGNRAGVFYSIYRPDPDSPGSYIGSSYVGMDRKGHHYGTELLIQGIRHDYRLPVVSRHHLKVTGIGRYLWKDIDGFYLADEAVLQIRKILEEMQVRAELTAEIGKTLLSPYDLCRSAVAEEVNPAWLSWARRAYEGFDWPESRLLEKTKNPGEIALMLVTGLSDKGQPEPAFEAFLDLTEGSHRYACFEGAVDQFWQDRQMEARNRPTKLLAAESENRTSPYGRLEVIKGLPDFSGLNPLEVLRQLRGPTAFVLDYGKPRTRVVSVLIHGDNRAGFEGMLAYLQNPESNPAANLVFLVHNVKAAQAGRGFENRFLEGEGQKDLNRLWLDLRDELRRRDPYVMDVLHFLSGFDIEAMLDLHETSGDSEPYAVLDYPDHRQHHLHESLGIAANLNLGSKILIMKATGTFAGGLRDLAPAISVECGQAGSAAAARAAHLAIGLFAGKPLLEQEAWAPSQSLFTVVASVKLSAPGIRIGLSNEVGGRGFLGIRTDIEAFNFQTIEAGDWIAQWDGPFLPLQVVTATGQDITSQYLILRGGKIIALRQMGVVMPTTAPDSIRRTELFHLIERVNDHDAEDITADAEPRVVDMGAKAGTLIYLRDDLKSAVAFDQAVKDLFGSRIGAKSFCDVFEADETGLVVDEVIVEHQQTEVIFTVLFRNGFSGSTGIYTLHWKKNPDGTVTKTPQAFFRAPGLGARLSLQLQANLVLLSQKSGKVTDYRIGARQMGRYVFRFLDGVSLDSQVVFRVHERIRQQARLFDHPVDMARMSLAISPRLLSELIVLRRMPKAWLEYVGDMVERQGYQFSDEQFLDVVRRPGLVCLLEQDSYVLGLDLKDQDRVSRFLKSIHESRSFESLNRLRHIFCEGHSSLPRHVRDALILYNPYLYPFAAEPPSLPDLRSVLMPVPWFEVTGFKNITDQRLVVCEGADEPGTLLRDMWATQVRHVLGAVKSLVRLVTVTGISNSGKTELFIWNLEKSLTNLGYRVITLDISKMCHLPPEVFVSLLDDIVRHSSPDVLILDESLFIHEGEMARQFACFADRFLSQKQRHIVFVGGGFLHPEGQRDLIQARLESLWAGRVSEHVSLTPKRLNAVQVYRFLGLARIGWLTNAEKKEYLEYVLQRIPAYFRMLDSVRLHLHPEVKNLQMAKALVDICVDPKGWRDDLEAIVEDKRPFQSHVVAATPGLLTTAPVVTYPEIQRPRHRLSPADFTDCAADYLNPQKVVAAPERRLVPSFYYGVTKGQQTIHGRSSTFFPHLNPPHFLRGSGLFAPHLPRGGVRFR